MKLLSFCTVIPSVVVVAWLPTTADAQTQEPAPVSATVIIRAHRPLSDALDRIQKILLKPINFEQAPYRSSQDVGSSSVQTTSGRKAFQIPHRSGI